MAEDAGIGVGLLQATEQAQQGAFLAGCAGVGGVAMLYPEEHRGKLALFGGMDNVKFKRPVVPGDQVVTKAELVRVRGDFGTLHADAYVDDNLVASADFKFALKKPDTV